MSHAMAERRTRFSRANRRDCPAGTPRTATTLLLSPKACHALCRQPRSGWPTPTVVASSSPRLAQRCRAYPGIARKNRQLPCKGCSPVGARRCNRCRVGARWRTMPQGSPCLATLGWRMERRWRSFPPHHCFILQSAGYALVSPSPGLPVSPSPPTVRAYSTPSSRSCRRSSADSSSMNDSLCSSNSRMDSIHSSRCSHMPVNSPASIAVLI